MALWLLAPWLSLVACVGFVVVGCVIVRCDVALMTLSARENQAERRYAAGLLDVLGNIGSVMCLRLQPSTHRLLARRLEAVFVPLKRMIVLNEVKWGLSTSSACASPGGWSRVSCGTPARGTAR